MAFNSVAPNISLYTGLGADTSVASGGGLVTLLTLGFNTQTGQTSLTITASLSASMVAVAAGAAILVGVQVDAEAIPIGDQFFTISPREAGISASGSITIQKPISAGAHTVNLVWRTTSSVANCNPISSPETDGAELLVVAHP